MRIGKDNQMNNYQEDYYIDDMYSDNPRCPVCGGLELYLGALGRLDWFNCQNCGMQFNQESDNQDNEE